jgi:RNA polymerase sigma-70 factor (ECF subfamily)
VHAVPAIQRLGGDWDERIVARIAAGDDAALGEVYDQLAPGMHALARRVTQDAALAEDIVQDVFVSLWQHPESFDRAQGTLRTWLSLLTHRRAVDLVRSRVAATRRDERSSRLAPTIAPDIAEAAGALVLGERVRAAVRELPADQREVVELAWFGGMTYREAAQRAGIPEGTAKSRLRLAMRKLASALETEARL